MGQTRNTHGILVKKATESYDRIIFKQIFEKWIQVANFSITLSQISEIDFLSSKYAYEFKNIFPYIFRKIVAAYKVNSLWI
jgi:hypothetical protein